MYYMMSMWTTIKLYHTVIDVMEGELPIVGYNGNLHVPHAFPLEIRS